MIMQAAKTPSRSQISRSQISTSQISAGCVTRPPVSIVLLNYNHAAFLPTALDAIRDQLESHDQLLAFDDASTDDSLSLYRSRLESTPQMRLIAHPRNLGVIASMNEGLALAEHDYVYFAASDDRILPGFLETALTLIAQYPSAGLVTSRCRLMDAEGRDLGIMPTPVVLPGAGYLDPARVRIALIRDDNWLVGCSTIYNRRHLAAVGGFLPELGSYCDGFASRLIALRHGACFTPEPLNYWRRLESGYSSTEANNMETIKNLAATAEELMAERYPDAFTPQYRSRWHRRWLFGALFYQFCREQAARRGPAGSAESPATLMSRGRHMLMNLQKYVVAAGLFIRWRAFDLPSVVARRLSYLFRRETRH